MSKTYKRPLWLPNGHFETIYPALFRKVRNLPAPEHQRLDTPDGDFLDLDWYRQDSKKLLILQHGLEGSSDRPYMLGMAKTFLANSYDVCSWNYRGCSDEMNKTPIFYHSGATYDLDLVVNECLKNYDEIVLIGFSLGGNLTLKYVGEAKRDARITHAVAISVPMDLSSASANLGQPHCFVYEKRFLNNLLHKIKEKESTLPGSMTMENLQKVKSLWGFDEYFTAPLHGFEGAEHYYAQNNSAQFLKSIGTQTLVLNAENDPLLTPQCLDASLTHGNPLVIFEKTKHGGHVGYYTKKDQPTWSEMRAIEFCLAT